MGLNCIPRINFQATIPFLLPTFFDPIEYNLVGGLGIDIALWVFNRHGHGLDSQLLEKLVYGEIRK